ncbi:MAG: zf-HC2 domain-containing protein [Planctomycetota bacterium]
MKNECLEIQPLLHDWVDGELVDPDRGSVVAHVNDCAACQQQVEGIRRLKKLVLAKAKQEPVPAGFHERLRERLYVQTEESASGRWRSPKLLAAAGIIVVGLIVTLVLNVGSSADYLVHAQTAQDALATHLESKAGLRRMSLEKARTLLTKSGLSGELPTLAGSPRFVGLREREFGGWCGGYQLCFETADGSTFSLIATPAEVRLGQTESLPKKAWKPGCCLCVRVDSHSVLCFRQGETHFWIVTEVAPERFYHEHVASAVRLRGAAKPK